MKTVVGFTNQFFTLWTISEPYQYFFNQHEFVMREDVTFHQNLSHDRDEAIRKAKEIMNVEHVEVDEDLRGQSRSFKRDGEKQSTIPADRFRFGKHIDTPIADCEDSSYIHWYYKNTFSEFAKEVLLSRGYTQPTEGSVELISPERPEWMIKQDRIAELSGHHFEEGKRIELKVKQIDYHSFNSTFGTTYIFTFETECGKVVKYMGSSYYEFSEEGFDVITASIVHDYYNGPETKLKRIKFKS